MFWLTFATAAVDIYRFAAFWGVLLSSYFFLWPLLVRLIILCRLQYSGVEIASSIGVLRFHNPYIRCRQLTLVVFIADISILYVAHHNPHGVVTFTLRSSRAPTVVTAMTNGSV